MGEEGGEPEPPEEAKDAKLCLNERWNLLRNTGVKPCGAAPIMGRDYMVCMPIGHGRLRAGCGDTAVSWGSDGGGWALSEARIFVICRRTPCAGDRTSTFFLDHQKHLLLFIVQLSCMRGVG